MHLECKFWQVLPQSPPPCHPICSTEAVSYPQHLYRIKGLLGKGVYDKLTSETPSFCFTYVDEACHTTASNTMQPSTICCTLFGRIGQVREDAIRVLDSQSIFQQTQFNSASEETEQEPNVFATCLQTSISLFIEERPLIGSKGPQFYVLQHMGYQEHGTQDEESRDSPT